MCFLLFRSDRAQSQLDRIARSGALASDSQGLHIADGALDPGIAELVAKGYVKVMELVGRTDHNHFTLTSKGREAIKQCLEVSQPCVLTKFERQLKSDSEGAQAKTTMELVLELTRNEWTDAQTGKSKKLTPYTPGGEKVWFWTPREKISKLYLEALLMSPQLFSKGLKHIHHCQPQAYYRACLQGFDPLPNQVLTYYQLLMSAGKTQHSAPKRRKPKAEPKRTGPQHIQGAPIGILEEAGAFAVLAKHFLKRFVNLCRICCHCSPNPNVILTCDQHLASV